MRLYILSILVLLLSCGAFAQPAYYYVSTTGDDTNNNCSVGAGVLACETLAKALSAASLEAFVNEAREAVVLIEPGSYVEAMAGYDTTGYEEFYLNNITIMKPQGAVGIVDFEVGVYFGYVEANVTEKRHIAIRGINFNLTASNSSAPDTMFYVLGNLDVIVDDCVFESENALHIPQYTMVVENVTSFTLQNSVLRNFKGHQNVLLAGFRNTSSAYLTVDNTSFYDIALTKLPATMNSGGVLGAFQYDFLSEGVDITVTNTVFRDISANVSIPGWYSRILNFDVGWIRSFTVADVLFTRIRSNFLSIEAGTVRKALFERVQVVDNDISIKFAIFMSHYAPYAGASVMPANFTMSDTIIDCGASQGIYTVADLDVWHAAYSNVTMRNCHGSTEYSTAPPGVYFTDLADSSQPNTTLAISELSILNCSMIAYPSTKSFTTSSFSQHKKMEIVDSAFEDIDAVASVVLFNAAEFLSLDNVRFLRNNVSRIAGSVYVKCTDEIVVNECTFEDNIGAFGTGISIVNDFNCSSSASKCAVVSSVFRNNEGIIGSGIYALGGFTLSQNITIQDSLFEYNKVDGYGTISMAGYNASSSLDLKDTIFKGNYQFRDDLKFNYTKGNASFMILPLEEFVEKDIQAYSNLAKNLTGGGASVMARYLASLTVSDSVFINNSVIGYLTASSQLIGGYGGAFFLLDIVDVRLKNASFLGNNANTMAGAIISFQEEAYPSFEPDIVPGHFAIDSCTFENNRATDVGAVFLLHTNGDIWNATLDIDNSRFTNNTANQGIAGDILVVAENVDIRNSRFEGSRAFSGGNIAILGFEGSSKSLEKKISTAIFRNTTFDKSRAITGGSFFMYNSGNTTFDIIFDNCKFRGNRADLFGGSVFTSDIGNRAKMSISACVFEDNIQLLEDKNIILNLQTSTVLKDLQLTDLVEYLGQLGVNLTGFSGGISVMLVTELNITDTTFLNNTSYGYELNDTQGLGGALFTVDVSHVWLEGVLFQDNVATGVGGAVCLTHLMNEETMSGLERDFGHEYSGRAGTGNQVRNTTFLNNRGGIAAGMFFYAGSFAAVGKATLEIRDGNMTGNAASPGVGGAAVFLMQLNESALVVENTEFTRNSGEIGGGALYVFLGTDTTTSAVLNVSRSSFSGNYAKGGGGGAALVNVSGGGERKVRFSEVVFEQNALNYTDAGDGAEQEEFTYNFIDTSIRFTVSNILQGGALYFLESGSVSLAATSVDSCSFSRNFAWQGGSVAINSSSAASSFAFSNNTFVGVGSVDCANVTNAGANGGSTPEKTSGSVRSGGAIAAVSPTNVGTHALTLDGNEFQATEVLISGGALYGKGPFKTLLRHNTFRNISACFHGGLIRCTDTAGFRSLGNSYELHKGGTTKNTVVSVTYGPFVSVNDTFDVTAPSATVFEAEFVSQMELHNVSLTCGFGEVISSSGSSYWDDFDNNTLHFHATSCVPCSRHSYSLVRGEEGTACLECPYGAASCEGGLEIRAAPKFWGFRHADGSVAFDLCPSGYCCERTDGLCEYDECDNHRTGILCGKCADGYSEALGSTGGSVSSNPCCVPTEECNGANALVFVAQMVATSVLYSLVLLVVGRSESSGWLKVVVYFFQMVGYVSPYASTNQVFDWALSLPSALLNMQFFSVYTAFATLSPFLLGSSSSCGLCVFPWVTPELKSMLSYLGPFVLLSTLLLIGGSLVAVQLVLQLLVSKVYPLMPVQLVLQLVSKVYEPLADAVPVDALMARLVSGRGKRSHPSDHGNVLEMNRPVEPHFDPAKPTLPSSSSPYGFEEEDDVSASDSDAGSLTNSEKSTGKREKESSGESLSGSDSGSEFTDSDDDDMKMSFEDRDFGSPGSKGMVWRLTSATVNVITMSYVIFFNTTLELLHCVILSDGKAHLFLSGELICPVWWQVPLAVLLMVILVPFPFMLLFFRFIVKISSVTRNATVVRSALAVLESPYRRHMKWWETILMFRRLVLIAIFSLVPYPFVRAYLFSAACALWLVLELLCNPFTNTLVSVMEKFSLSMLLLLSMLNIREGTMISSGVVDHEDTLQPLISALFFFFSVLSRFVMVAFTVLFLFWALLKRIGLDEAVASIVDMFMMEMGNVYDIVKEYVPVLGGIGIFKDDPFDDVDDDDDDDDDLSF